MRQAGAGRFLRGVVRAVQAAYAGLGGILRRTPRGPRGESRRRRLSRVDETLRRPAMPRCWSFAAGRSRSGAWAWCRRRRSRRWRPAASNGTSGRRQFQKAIGQGPFCRKEIVPAAPQAASTAASGIPIVPLGTRDLLEPANFGLAVNQPAAGLLPQLDLHVHRLGDLAHFCRSRRRGPLPRHRP